MWVAVFLTFAVGITSLLLTKRLRIATRHSQSRAVGFCCNGNCGFKKVYMNKFQKSPKSTYDNAILIVGAMFLSQSVTFAV